MDCSPPGYSVHAIFQARILEWVAMPASRGSSLPRDRICVSCIAGRFSIAEPLGKPGLSHGRRLRTVEDIILTSFMKNK